jgi:hypothetical protein
MPYAGQLTRALKASRILVLVLSKSSNASGHVLREVQIAADSRLHIVQFRIEAVEVSDDLLYYLSAPHWIDALSPAQEDHLAKLVHAVSGLLELPTRATEQPKEKAPGQTESGGAFDFRDLWQLMLDEKLEQICLHGGGRTTAIAGRQSIGIDFALTEERLLLALRPLFGAMRYEQFLVRGTISIEHTFPTLPTLTISASSNNQGLVVKIVNPVADYLKIAVDQHLDELRLATGQQPTFYDKETPITLEVPHADPEKIHGWLRMLMSADEMRALEETGSATCVCSFSKLPDFHLAAQRSTPNDRRAPFEMRFTLLRT